jgi:spermidine/putrescine-binding protein
MNARAYFNVGLRLSIVALMLLSLQTKADEVKIYTWEEYISDDVISQFEEDTGHKVTQVYFENEQLRDEVVTTERVLAYDLFIIDSFTLNLYASTGFAKNLKEINFPNSKHIDKDATNICGEWGAPYSWGTMGIGYRESRFEEPLHSWAQIFSLAQQGKKFVILSDDVDTVSIALLSLGLDPFTNNDNQLKQAFKVLSDAKKDILQFRAPAGYALEMKQESKMDAAVIYSGETYTLSEATGQDDWVYSVPDEGTLVWYECFAAPGGKTMSAAAMAFLNFINEPEIAAQNAEDIWLATTNKSALDYVSEEYLMDEELFPTNPGAKKRYYYSSLSADALSVRTKIMSVLHKK